jgi:hypothetical protein
MAEEVVAHDVAVAEFERMCAERGVDIDESTMTEADKKSLKGHREKIVAAIVRGELTVADDGTPTFTPSNPPKGVTSFTFYEAIGADLMASDAVDGSIRKTVTVVTSMTRSEVGSLSKLRIRDFNLCCALGNLFLD